MATNQQKSDVDSGVRPVIFIGLGSTGAKIVSLIYEDLTKNADEFAKKFYRYYNITSEVDPEKGTSLGCPRFVLARKQLTSRQAISPLCDVDVSSISSDFKRWWYAEEDGTKPWVPPVASLDAGSGGLRSIGRALLHSKCMDQKSNLIANFKEILNSIRNAVENLKQPEERARVNLSSINCYLFGLLAGGTCSGTLLDIAFLIKAGLGALTNLFGVFLLGDVCYDGIPYREQKAMTKHIQMSNTAYALAELALVQSKTGFNIIKNEWPRRIGVLDLGSEECRKMGLFDQKPFNNITLIGAKNDDGFSFNKGGNQFMTYHHFVAKYYSDFFTSEACQRQVGRIVDRNMESAQRIDMRWPSRPNDFQRIGYMCIQVPKDKVLALVNCEVAECIGLNMFKNAEESRCKALLEAFLARIGWDILASDRSEFAPSVENEPIISSDEPLPGQAKEFEDTWQQTMHSVDSYYAQQTSADKPEVKRLVQKFSDKWKRALSDLLDNLLGQTAGQRLSMGSAKWIFETLLKLVNDRIGKLTATEKDLQADLFNKENPSSSKAQFDACLQNETSAFPPRKRLNLLGNLTRKHWPGASNVEQALRTYKGRLRAYSITVTAKAALEPLRNELMIMSVVRKVIAEHAARGIFETNIAVAASIFAASSGDDPIVQEVISDRENTNKCFVQPILSATAYSDTKDSRKDFAASAQYVEKE